MADKGQIRRGLDYVEEHQMNGLEDLDMVVTGAELHAYTGALGVARAVIMKGREYRGCVYVSQDGMRIERTFDYGNTPALAFNKKAKASREKR